MLCMCANGSLWEKAAVGVSPIYDSLVKGWAKWNSEHAGNPGITETDYPHVDYFDSHINPPALRRLLLSMLNPDPAQRVTMAGVASNRWLKVVECCQSDKFEIEPVEIDAAKSPALHQKKMHKAVLHNHQPPQTHAGHKLGLLHGSPGR
jgi:protein-serine/threonine kinase